MIVDGLLTFDLGTTLAASGGASANTIDLLQVRDIGVSDVDVWVYLGAALAGGTITVQVQTSTDNTTWTTLLTSGTVAIGSTGPVFRDRLPTGVKRYLRLNYVGTGITGGTVNSGLGIDGPVTTGQPYYPRNFQS